MRKRKKGSVMLECILVLPVILLAGICALEFTRCLRAIKIAQSLSSEIANTAFRECSSRRDLMMTNCLQEIQAQINTMALTIDNRRNANNGVIDDGESSFAMATVFVREQGIDYQADTELPQSRAWPTCRIFGVTMACSEVAASIAAHGEPPLRESNDVLIVGQGFARHRSLLAPIAGLFGFRPEDRFFCDATVI